MRSLKKPLLLLLAVALATSAGVYATVAFFTDVEEVDNTFTVGKVDIMLDETKIDPSTGNAEVDGNGNPIRTDDGNVYHMVPSMIYDKDPTVTIKSGSETSYLRMILEINCQQELDAIFGTFRPNSITSGYSPEKWILVGTTQTGTNTIAYEYRYHTTVASDPKNDIQLEPLFKYFFVPSDLDGADLQSLQALHIRVQAHAIQAEGFADANAAWQAFSGQVKGGNVIQTSALNLLANDPVAQQPPVAGTDNDLNA